MTAEDLASQVIRFLGPVLIAPGFFFVTLG
jgi:hypothetical protein